MTMTRSVRLSQEGQLVIFERFVLCLPNTTPGVARVLRRQGGCSPAGEVSDPEPDALHVATALLEKAEAFLTNDKRLKRLQAEGMMVLALKEYL